MRRVINNLKQKILKNLQNLQNLQNEIEHREKKNVSLNC